MKKYIVFATIILFSSSAFASMYVVERPDGGVSIVNYVDGSSDSLEDVLRDLGFKGFPILEIDQSDIPKSKEDRSFWVMNKVPMGSKIKVDSAKKQAHLDALAGKETEKLAILEKMGISKAEYEKVFEKELVSGKSK